MLFGRFVMEDLARQGVNWYTYTTNNPLNRIDPTGLEWEFNKETWEWTATEETDYLWQLTKKAGFDSWQEAADYAGIRDRYDDDGNWIGGKSTLKGLKIKAPLDIYTANFTGFDGSLLEFGFGETDATIVLSGAVFDVFVENSRTNDAFSTRLISYVKEAG